MNWESEIRKLIQDYFLSFEIDYKPKKTNTYNYLIDFMNLKMKLIENNPRTILKSDKFKSIQLPYDEFQALLFIDSKIRRGEDITFHQSKNILNPTYNDMLLNDWVIHHIHLSKTKKNPSQKFYDRSGYILFVAFSKHYAYFIDIKKHKETNLFSKREFLEIMDNNWPEVMKNYYVKDEEQIRFSSDHSDSDIHILRKKGFMTGMTNVNGKVIMSPGFGYMTSGHNIHVVRRANDVVRRLHQSQEEINNSWSEILNEIQQTENIEELDIHLKLVDEYPYFVFFEKNSKSFITKKNYI